MKRTKFNLPVINVSEASNSAIINAAKNNANASGYLTDTCNSSMFTITITDNNTNGTKTGYIYQIIKNTLVCWTFDKNNALYTLINNVNAYYSTQLSAITVPTYDLSVDEE